MSIMIAANNSTIVQHNFLCIRHKMLCLENYRADMDLLYGHFIFGIVLNAFLALAAVSGNGLVLAAYHQNESLRKPVDTILLCLAATDFLSGAISQPFFIFEKGLMTGGCKKTVCIVAKLEQFFMSFLRGAIICNLSVTALDRYIAVCHPYKYPELVTNSRVVKLLASVWLFCLSVSLVGVIFDLVSFICVFMLLFNIIFIIVSYVMIFREIQRLQSNVVTIANDPDGARKAEERKTAQTVAIIIGLLVLCFLPMIIYSILAKISIFKIPREQIMIYAVSAVYSNSSLNVLVYFWRNKQMRKAMLKALRKMTPNCITNQDNP